MKLWLRLGLIALVAFAGGESVGSAAESNDNNDTVKAESKVSYSQQIEPIFRRNCFGCHQGAKQLGKYRMTDFRSLLVGGESGDPAIVPGKPDESYLVDQISLVDGAAEMPKSPSKPLNQIEIDLVRKWITEGAVDDSEAAQGPAYTAESPPNYQGAPAVTSIDVSPNGETMAVAGYHEVLLVNLKDDAPVRRLVGISPRINGAQFSPDGSRLAAVGGTPGLEGEIQIWNTTSGELELSVSSTFDTLAGVAWSPDGSQLAYGATDNVVRAIDTSTGQQVLYQGAHEDWIRDVAFTPDGKHLVSIARDMSCKLTEVETERFVDNVTSITPGALSGGLSRVAMHPDRNEIVIGGADGIVKVYRIFRETARKIGDDANLVRNLPPVKGRIFDVKINHDASRIAAVATLDGKTEVRVWAYDFDGKLTEEFKKIIAKRVNERSAAEKKTLSDYRAAETTELVRLDLDVPAYAIAFAPDDTLLVAATDGQIRRLKADGTTNDPISILPSGKTNTMADHSFEPGVWLNDLESIESESISIDSVATIEVSPQEVSINSPYEYAQLVITGVTADGERIDVTRGSRFEPSAGIIVNPSGLVSLNASDGQNEDGKLQIFVGSHQATVAVRAGETFVTGDGSVDFVRDVNPVLSRLGCNQGTCHGAQKGKNGFKLSLRGYDPIYDLRALTDDLAARRINAAAPEQSLMLRKPLGYTPHEGGVLMAEGDPYHAVLRRWIADGSAVDLDSPRVSKLEIFPSNPVVQAVGTKQQVRLVAHYTDGRTRDVTREAFIESGNMEVAKADRGGLLTALRRGEAAILARYEGNYVASTLTVMGDRTGYEEDSVPAWGQIDEWVAQKWRRVKVQPSELSSDAAFLRRVTLDLTGLPPTSQKVREFLSDQSSTREKRAAEIDRLLQTEAYVEYWTNKWASLLQVNRKFLGVEGSRAFHDWIREAVEQNRPYDEFARQILTATGSNKENPAASYFKVLRNPEDTMENTTHLFLGIRFNCNKCHDHPFERWTQDQYFEMAAFFGQTALEPDPESKGKKIGGTAVEGAKPLYEKVVDKTTGDVTHGRTGNVVLPNFPYEVSVDEDDTETRRERLAGWMTNADNPYFALSHVNRLWGYLMGVGLIEPIDDIRAGNPPTNPQLLDYLADQFVDSGFDTKAMLREICNSRTYQLSVETNSMNEDDTLNYAHAMPRRLPAEVIYDAVHALTGATSNIPGMPKGTRAAAVSDSGVKLADGFLQNLGRPVRESACECERSSELQLGPIMALIGGPTIAGAIADPQNELERIVAENPDDRELAEEIFLRSVGRMPSEAEFAAFDRIKQQISSDHERLVAELSVAEQKWETQKSERERIRTDSLESTKQALAARTVAAKPEQDRLAEERKQRIKVATEKLAETETKLAGKVKAWEKANASSIEWHPLRPTKMSSTNKATLISEVDRSIRATGEAGKATYTIEIPTSLKNITGFRLEALSDEGLPAKGPGTAENGNYVITEFEIDVASNDAPAKFGKAAIKKGFADFLQGGFKIEQTFDGNARGQGGWAVAGATGVDHWATYQLAKPIENTAGCVLRFKIHQFHNAVNHQLGLFRISATTNAGELSLGLPESLAAIVATPEAARDEKSQKRLLDHVGRTDQEKIKAVAALAAARKPVQPDAQTTELEQQIKRLSVETPEIASMVRLRSDVQQSVKQLETVRLTAAEDLTWALINSPAFLFNH